VEGSTLLLERLGPAGDGFVGLGEPSERERALRAGS
jgi:hypothetical protein